MPNEEESHTPHNTKIQDHWNEYAEYGPKCMQDVMSLVRKHYDDGVEKTDECQRTEDGEETCLKESTRCEGQENNPCEEA